MPELLLSTKNQHKILEIQEVFRSVISDSSILSLDSYLHNAPDIVESLDTIEGNAYLKSVEIFNFAQIPTLSDDSGLEIDALDGKPGVFSSRYSGENASDSSNRKRVLEELKNVPSEKRSARFRTVLCYTDNLRTIFFEGICEGTITNEEFGERGFGYDQIFIPLGSSKTFGQMDMSEKNEFSHRKKALSKFLEFYKTINEHHNG
jgi:XTP/dITP diphosphohydrolase